MKINRLATLLRLSLAPPSVAYFRSQDTTVTKSFFGDTIIIKYGGYEPWLAYEMRLRGYCLSWKKTGNATLYIVRPFCLRSACLSSQDADI